MERCAVSHFCLPWQKTKKLWYLLAAAYSNCSSILWKDKGESLQPPKPASLVITGPNFPVQP